MFSDLFYLSSLLNLSLAFNEEEKQEIFNDSRKNTKLCMKAIKILEKEIQNLTSINEARKTKLSNLDKRTLLKTNIIEEVKYAQALKNRFNDIRKMEIQDNEELCQN